LSAAPTGQLEVGTEPAQDPQEDAQHLAGQLVGVMGGQEGLQVALPNHATQIGRPVALRPLQKWLQPRHNPTVPLQQTIEDSVSDIHAKLCDLQDAVDELRCYMKQGGPASTTRPALMIPRSSLIIDDGAVQAGAAGTYGTVVPALLNGVKVAVKLYNFRPMGSRDTRGAVREALLVSRLSSPHVVRCFGIVDDPDTESCNSIHGSLVMDWVDGGELYTFLQNHDAGKDGELPLLFRLAIAVQVAAGMAHMPARKVMHGDLKPQNLLLVKVPVAVTDYPQVCDSTIQPAAIHFVHQDRALIRQHDLLCGLAACNDSTLYYADFAATVATPRGSMVMPLVATLPGTFLQAVSQPTGA
jgi:hypothetical protein